MSRALRPQRLGARSEGPAADGGCAIRTAFVQETAASASRQWRQVADSLRPRFEKLALLMDDAEADVLAFMTFPSEHHTRIHSTNPLERVNKEIKRRTNVVGIFPNEAAILRLVGAVLIEQNGEWGAAPRDMMLETVAPLGDAVDVTPPANACGVTERFKPQGPATCPEPRPGIQPGPLRLRAGCISAVLNACFRLTCDVPCGSGTRLGCHVRTSKTESPGQGLRLVAGSCR